MRDFPLMTKKVLHQLELCLRSGLNVGGTALERRNLKKLEVELFHGKFKKLGENCPR
jgi:hypothetical protein